MHPFITMIRMTKISLHGSAYCTTPVLCNTVLPIAARINYVITFGGLGRPPLPIKYCNLFDVPKYNQ